MYSFNKFIALILVDQPGVFASRSSGMLSKQLLSKREGGTPVFKDAAGIAPVDAIDIYTKIRSSQALPSGNKGIDMTTQTALPIRSVRLVQYILWMVFAVMFFAAYLPVITGLVRAWALSDDYSHGFVIIPLAAYMLWQKRETLHNAPIQQAWSGLHFATASLLVYVIAQKGGMQTIASVSMICFLCGTVILLFGYAIFRICFFPIMILFFMIPVPGQIIAALTIPLQLIVTKASVWGASIIGIPIYHEGNVIHIPNGTFQVVQACSGLRSIMTLLTLGAVLAYLTLRSGVLRGILFILTIPIAIAINIFRVFVLIATFHFLEIDLSKGTIHTILGIAVFAIAFGLFLLARKGLALCEQ